MRLVLCASSVNPWFCLVVLPTCGFILWVHGCVWCFRIRVCFFCESMVLFDFPIGNVGVLLSAPCRAHRHAHCLSEQGSFGMLLSAPCRAHRHARALSEPRACCRPRPSASPARSSARCSYGESARVRGQLSAAASEPRLLSAPSVGIAAPVAQLFARAASLARAGAPAGNACPAEGHAWRRPGEGHAAEASGDGRLRPWDKAEGQRVRRGLTISAASRLEIL